jgi:hypothetical protein
MRAALPQVVPLDVANVISLITDQGDDSDDPIDAAVMATLSQIVEDHTTAVPQRSRGKRTTETVPESPPAPKKRSTKATRDRRHIGGNAKGSNMKG